MSEQRLGHSYHIWKSMMRTPEILEACLVQPIKSSIERVADHLAELGTRRVFCSGTGSSSYASIVHAMALQQVAGLHASCHVTSELGAYPPPDLAKGSLLLVTSHTGHTAGDVSVVKLAKQRGVYTIGVTDIANSPLAEVVNETLLGPGGPKEELPATRTYVAAMFRVIQLALALATRLDRPNLGLTLEELHKLPGTLRSFLESFTPQASEYATRLIGVKQYFVISAGPNMSTAQEGALILLQSTDAGALAFHVEEMLHGPIQALRSGMGVIAVAAPGPLQARILQSAQACAMIGATVLTIIPQDTATTGGAGMCIHMPPGVPEILTPLLYIVPFWLIGYHCALASGRDPDNLSRDRPEFKRAFRLLMAGDPRFVGAPGSG